MFTPMTPARNRQPFKSDYVSAVGRATLCFTLCEWNVVYCCERIQPGTLQRIVGDELTAGRIAKRFVNLVSRMSNSAESTELLAVANRFSDLVTLRNRIIHGKPCTGPNGEARLSSTGVLEVPELEAAADSFAECSDEANRLLHGFLSTYSPQR